MSGITSDSKIISLSSGLKSLNQAFPAMVAGTVYKGRFDFAPILASRGLDVGGYKSASDTFDSSIEFTGDVFVTQKQSHTEVEENGDYYINFYTGFYLVKAGASATPTATYKVSALHVIADIIAEFSDEMRVNPNLRVLAEGEVTVVTAGTPVAVAANANAKAVLIMNNNEDGTIAACGLQATVDALSTPRIGRVLGAGDSTPIGVLANSNEVYVDSTISGKKFTYQILG